MSEIRGKSVSISNDVNIFTFIKVKSNVKSGGE
jgi:hypothetical protein